jgi:5-methylthioribose kinase
MREVTPETAAEYLRETGRVSRDQTVSVQALGWGVSNVVMRVDVEGEPSFVLKQAREQLRTRAHWVSRLDRIWNERAAMELLAPCLPEGTIPRVLFADPENYLFAMTCAPDDSVVWKERLLAGDADPEVARRAGSLLGTMHAATRNHPDLQTGRLTDLTVFDQLRIDPFYRTIAAVHPEIAPRIESLIDSSMTNPPRGWFVHADFSPKNILVHSRGITLVDFETAHAGDPAYDLGFLLSHLVLKTIRAAPDQAALVALIPAVSEAYGEKVAGLADEGFTRRAALHLAACTLARIDGKSPVDYLDAPRREAARRFAIAALGAEPLSWDRIEALLAREMRKFSSES